LLLAAWHPGRMARLVLIDATFAAQRHLESSEARALRDCPPDWPALRRAVHRPLLDLRWTDTALDTLGTFLQIP
jgi:hypothetical protein